MIQTILSREKLNKAVSKQNLLSMSGLNPAHLSVHLGWCSWQLFHELFEKFG